MHNSPAHGQSQIFIQAFDIDVGLATVQNQCQGSVSSFPEWMETGCRQHPYFCTSGGSGDDHDLLPILRREEVEFLCDEVAGDIVACSGLITEKCVGDCWSKCPRKFSNVLSSVNGP